MDDKVIINLFLKRKESAIKQTDKKYGNYLHKVAFNILGLREDAEECVNDTYMAAWNQIPPQIPKKLLAYLGRITRNISLDRFKFLTAKKRNSNMAVLFSELEDCIPSNNYVEGDVEYSELIKVINMFLEECNQEMRNIFVRRYWYCEAISDIALRYKVSESKVKSMLFRSRKRLKIYLDEEGFAV